MADEPERLWVALITCVNSSSDPHAMMWEAGGIYPDSNKPENSACEAARLFDSGEPVAVCPRCGQRFAASNAAEKWGTAEACRDLHFDGDEDIPSICRNFAPRHLRLAKGGA